MFSPRFHFTDLKERENLKGTQRTQGDRQEWWLTAHQKWCKTRDNGITSAMKDQKGGGKPIFSDNTLPKWRKI